MNRSTLIALVTLVVLGGAWLALESGDGPAAGPPPLAIDGFIGDVTENAARAAMKDQASPYTRYVVQRGEGADAETWTLTKLEGEDNDKPEWQVVRERAGTTSTSRAQRFRVDQLHAIFARPVHSSFSTPIGEGDRAEFGLAPAHRIRLEASAPGQDVKLVVGAVVEGSGRNPGGAADSVSTWVQHADRPDVAYQIAGRDLRKPLDVPFKDVRARKVLDIDKAKVDTLTVRPNAPDAKEIRLKRAAWQAPADGDKERASGDGWTFEAPANTPVGPVGTWLDALERLSASGIEDPGADGKAPAESGLDGPEATVITIRAGDASTELVVGPVPKEGDAWLRVEGEPLLFRLPKWAHGQIVKKLSDLKRQTPLEPGALADATAVAVTVAGKEAWRASKGEQGWVVRGSAGPIRTDSGAVEQWLTDVAAAQVAWTPDTNAEDAGLGNPSRVLRFTLPGGELTWKLGGEAGDKVYGQVDSGELFAMTSWNRKKLEKTAEDFRDQRLFAVDAADVTALTLEASDRPPLSARKEGDGWTAKGPAGEVALDGGAVQRLLGTLVNARYESREPSKRPADVGLKPSSRTVHWQTADGRKGTLSLSTQKKGTSPYAMATGGPDAGVVVTISGITSSGLDKGLDELKAK